MTEERPRRWDEPDPALERMAHPHKTITLRTVRERERLMAGLEAVEMNTEEDPQT